MSTQLRLVEPPAPRRKPARRRARVVRGGQARRVHWGSDWRIDETARQVGRQGIAAAREALARAERADDERLSKAS
jgi:hypothetical protein